MAYTTIKKPSDYFNTKLYTGNGSLPRAITGVGHQPDFVWIKNRDVGYHHQLYDSVRGTSAGVLYSSLADAEDSTYQMSSFDSDGYTMGSNLGAVNGSGENIVAWNWRANGTGSANTDGSISSTVSANTTSGFSIVKWTGNGTAGATVGHGLGSEMKFMILKDYGLSRTWITYHTSLGGGSGINLNENGVAGTSSAYWNNTSPTSSVFSTGVYSNENNSNYICYCFADVTGYSKFGSYVGNGNADGTFVYTGFKPAFVMVKRTDTTGTWHINDTKRDTHNRMSHSLFPNLASAESTTGWFVDYVSNGFKIRDTGNDVNASGGSYIYMAFAEEPLVGDNPATAR